MKIVNMTDRELTEDEIASIRRFRSYTDGIGFACIGANVMVMLSDEVSGAPQDMKKAALRCMEAALHEHPDMETYRMDDGHDMVALPAGIFAISREKQSGSTMAARLMLRDACLAACERGEVIAVMYEED